MSTVTPTANLSMVRAAMKAPYLERDEEHQLALRWKHHEDQQALHLLTQSHMRLVIAIASRFRTFGLPMQDLIQEGHVGLLEAAARFDPDRNVRFSTYATWWIRASIQDHVLRNWSIVRGGTSSAQKSLFFNLRRLRAKLSKGNAAIAEIEIHRQIADAIGVQVGDVALMAARLSGPDSSLNVPIGDSEGSADRMDLLVSSAPLPDEMVAEEIDGERRLLWLKQAMSVLSEREARILRDRRLDEAGVQTLEAIGMKLGISKERVRQIETRAMEKLRLALLRAHPELSEA